MEIRKEMVREMEMKVVSEMVRELEMGWEING
jgi:hypothetical protein